MGTKTLTSELKYPSSYRRRQDKWYGPNTTYGKDYGGQAVAFVLNGFDPGTTYQIKYYFSVNRSKHFKTYLSGASPSIGNAISNVISSSGLLGSGTLTLNTPAKLTACTLVIENIDDDGIFNAELSYATAYSRGDDTPPSAPTLISPANNASVDGYVENTFKWSLGASSAFPISNVQIQFKKSTDTSWTIFDSWDSAKTSCVVDTFRSLGYEGAVNWRVRAKTLYSDYAYSDARTVNVNLAKPVLTPTSPVSGSLRGNTAITFKWSSSNATPKQTQLQCSYDKKTWTTYSVDLGAKTVTIPAKTFKTGTLYWRVRATNQYYDYGAWSSIASFTVAESLPTSEAVTHKYVDRTVNNVLEWKSSNDYGSIGGAQVQYYNSGTWTDIGSVSGTTKKITVSAGTLPSASSIKWRVRSRNSGGEYGAWAQNTIATIDAETVATPTSPIKGTSLDETKAITFKWSVSNSLGSTQTGADIQWRRNSESQWNDFPHVSGTALTYKAPANTFPGDVIYWRVRAYNQSNAAGNWSSEAYFSTVDTPSVATPVSPNGTIEDTSEPVLFTWNVSNQSGTASTGADLQYSIDNLTWVTFAHTDGEKSVSVPGGTFPPGVIYWRARSYNRNQYPGAWSNSASFVSRAAPIVKTVDATEVPFSTVTWQSDDQQSFEVFVDNVKICSYFGDERQYQLPEYLSDGDHKIGVRVLGSYALWSQITETTIHIENESYEQIVVRARTNIDTELTFENGSGNFYVYRDEKLIAHTDAMGFADRVTLGTHDYFVVERLPDGNYNPSNSLTRTMDVDCLHIAAVAGGDWIAIPHTLKGSSDPVYKENIGIELSHMDNREYPIANVGPYRDDNGTYSAVFLYTEESDHQRFRALIRKPVILKTRDGEVFIGVLNAWERKPKTSRYKKYYTAYSFTLQRIDWEDFIDDTR